MEYIVNALGELAADVPYLAKIFHPGARYFLQPAELREQHAAALGPEAGDVFQRGTIAGFAAPLPMAGDCKAVRFVADLLDEMQCWRVGRKYKRLPLLRQEQRLQSWAPRLAFRNAHDQHALDLQFLQHRHGLRHLALATVDQQDVRQNTLALLDARVTPRQGLAHGGVIVAGRDPGDIETTIVGLDHAFGVEHHAGGHRRLAHAVADIEALDAFRPLIEAERLLQRLEALQHIGHSSAQG